jgi:hypothetical protein
LLRCSIRCIHEIFFLYALICNFLQKKKKKKSKKRGIVNEFSNFNFQTQVTDSPIHAKHEQTLSSSIITITKLLNNKKMQEAQACVTCLQHIPISLSAYI